jgi:uncharacterized membrane protein
MSENPTHGTSAAGLENILDRHDAVRAGKVDVEPEEVVHRTVPKMEGLIGTVLIVGVLTAAAIVLVGGAVFLWRHGSEYVNYRVFRKDSRDLRTLEDILNGVKELSGRALIQLGLVFLVALQVIRVLLTGILFSLTRNRVFTLITFVVLGLLLYGLLLQGR